MAFLIFLIVVFVGIPVLWQLPRTFLPARLNESGTKFTGIYGRYSVETFTGYASEVRTWTADHKSVGSMTAYTSAYGSYATTTISDNRRHFSSDHTGFFLRDAAGEIRTVDAANVGPSVGEGHLVSAAALVHNGKVGNTFLVYNHSTDQVFVENLRRGQRAPRRSLLKMLFPLPTLTQVLLFIGIVTIPLVVLLGLGAHWQVRRFAKRGDRPLVAALTQQAAAMPPASSVAETAPAQPSTSPLDLASQVREITTLYESGALTSGEFTAAKARLLGSS